MKIKEVIKQIEESVPLNYAEDFDNVGLLVGDDKRELTGILVALDTLEDTVDEAIAQNCNLIVAFHPIIFGGLKSLTGKTYVERVVQKAIKHDVQIYAIHTALDNHLHGVNFKMAEVLGLTQTQILMPQKNTLMQLNTYVPLDHYSAVQQALFSAGAGSVGNYDSCSFGLLGEGSFKPNNQAQPHTGKPNEWHVGEEKMLHVVFEKHKQQKVLHAMFESHPYEEVAYELIPIANENQQIGIGMLGELPQAKTEKEFINQLKNVFGTPVIRHSALRQKPVKKVAVLGGSGAFAISAAISKGADVLVTADLKYHDFFKAEDKILLTDIGHYESEQFTKNLLHALLTKKFPNFAIVLSEKSTNPIQYS
ncbi:Nif3-like dinuclear metal center hexameric protein [Mesonia sp. HuA40]|uniref:Nif3-like dinuclear metal center hexameric protein n=1 Tax=Mesonia sp. HuA40 TaxID=2602761 RepID=UPI0011CAE24F|nr:Nif3-like dinuclear metal center hexameric protein [Mesonia sp. HuA40]TXK73812.1 Nif3-like dinuclear metal center hexameric protein [Mesonia sp. HuA40]